MSAVTGAIVLSDAGDLIDLNPSIVVEMSSIGNDPQGADIHSTGVSVENAFIESFNDKIRDECLNES